MYQVVSHNRPRTRLLFSIYIYILIYVYIFARERSPFHSCRTYVNRRCYGVERIACIRIYILYRCVTRLLVCANVRTITLGLMVVRGQLRVGARQICNAALPLKPLIHKTLLPTLIIHVSSVHVCAETPRGKRGREGEGRKARARAECGYIYQFHKHFYNCSLFKKKCSFTLYSVFDNKLVIFLKIQGFLFASLPHLYPSGARKYWNPPRN